MSADTFFESTNQSFNTRFDAFNNIIRGKDGLTPYIKDDYWYIGEENTGVKAVGAISFDELTDAQKDVLIKALEAVALKNYATYRGQITEGTIERALEDGWYHVSKGVTGLPVDQACYLECNTYLNKYQLMRVITTSGAEYIGVLNRSNNTWRLNCVSPIDVALQTSVVYRDMLLSNTDINDKNLLTGLYIVDDEVKNLPVTAPKGNSYLVNYVYKNNYVLRTLIYPNGAQFQSVYDKVDDKVLFDWKEVNNIQLSTQGEKLVFMGDSIFGNNEDSSQDLPKKIAYYLQTANFDNCAFGGSMASHRGNPDMSPFSLHQLVDDMLEYIQEQKISNETGTELTFEPFKKQYDAIWAKDENGDYILDAEGNHKIKTDVYPKFQDKIDRLVRLTTYNKDESGKITSVPFSDVSRLIITIGSNDWNYGAPIQPSEDNKSNIWTFVGALNYFVEKMQTAFPKLRIYLLPCPQKFIIEETKDNSGNVISTAYLGNGDTYPNKNGDTVKDFADACMQCAKDNHIPTIDIYNNAGINTYNYQDFYYDGSHFNPTGCDRVGRLIASTIKGMQ